MKVQKLLKDESKWCKRHYAQNAEGQEVSPISSKACKWCLSSAIGKCYRNEKEHAKISLRVNMLIQKLFPGMHFNIVGFNDAPLITFRDIKEICEILDI